MGNFDVQFLLNGTPGSTPANSRELQIIHEWNTPGASNVGSDEDKISTNELDFSLSDADYIQEWFDGGLVGGPGVFEGIPYTIRIKEGANSTDLNFFINLTNGAIFKSDCQVSATLEKQQSLNWLEGYADSFSFAYLSSLPAGTPGRITSNDYVKIPYVLNYRPEAFALAMISMSLFMMTKELITAVKLVIDSAAEFSAAIANSPFSIGLFIGATIKLVASIAYAVAMVIGIIALMNDLLEQLFPPVRRYYGMKVSTLFQRGCEYLGLNFSSSIFLKDKWKNLVLLPTKDKKGGFFGAANGVGYPNTQSAVYGFGDLIRRMSEMFNAEPRIINGTLYFERLDFWNNQSSWVLPDVLTNQSDRRTEFSPNTKELVSNYLLDFTVDIQDQNTLENFKGTNYQIITQPISIINKKNVSISGLSELKFPFSLAIRKNELTEVEQALSDLLGIADSVVNALGGNSNLANSITNRIGMMSLSADTTSVDKLLIIDNEEIPAAASEQLSAKNLWDEFHFINSFVEITEASTGVIHHNQNLVYSSVKVPFCYEDYLKVINNNKFKDSLGREGTLLRMSWNVFDNTAEIDYKIKQLYTKNLILAFQEGV